MDVCLCFQFVQLKFKGLNNNQYNIVNNYFVGGIKTLYTKNSSGGGGGSTSTVNVVRNGSLDAVTLENWSKSYVEENPS